MKIVCRIVAVAFLFVSASAFAATFDGTYTFSSRTIADTASMQGWQGTMTIKGNEMARTYKSAEGQEKFYVSTLTKTGDIYTLKLTKSYKPEQVGEEHRNKITLSGNILTISSEDGKFQEVWTKR